MRSFFAITLGIAAATIITTTSYAAIKHHISSHHRRVMVSKLFVAHNKAERSAPATSVAQAAPLAQTEADEFGDLFSSMPPPPSVAQIASRPYKEIVGSVAHHKLARRDPRITNIAQVHHVAHKPVAPAAQ